MFSVSNKNQKMKVIFSFLKEWFIFKKQILCLAFFKKSFFNKRSVKWLFFLVLAYVSAINELKTARFFSLFCNKKIEEEQVLYVFFFLEKKKTKKN